MKESRYLTLATSRIGQVVEAMTEVERCHDLLRQQHQPRQYTPRFIGCTAHRCEFGFIASQSVYKDRDEATAACEAAHERHVHEILYGPTGG